MMIACTGGTRLSALRVGVVVVVAGVVSAGGSVVVGAPTADEMAALRERVSGVMPQRGCMIATFDTSPEQRAQGYFGERLVMFDVETGACAEVGPRGHVVVDAGGVTFAGTAERGGDGVSREVDVPPHPAAWQSALLVGVYMPVAYVRAMLVEPSYIYEISTRDDGVMLVKIGRAEDEFEATSRRRLAMQAPSTPAKLAETAEPAVCGGEPTPINPVAINRIRPFTIHLDQRGMPILIETRMMSYPIEYADPEKGLLQPAAGWASKVVVDVEVREEGCEAGVFDLGEIERMGGEIRERHLAGLSKFMQQVSH